MTKEMMLRQQATPEVCFNQMIHYEVFIILSKPLTQMEHFKNELPISKQSIALQI